MQPTGRATPASLWHRAQQVRDERTSSIIITILSVFSNSNSNNTSLFHKALCQLICLVQEPTYNAIISVEYTMVKPLVEYTMVKPSVEYTNNICRVHNHNYYIIIIISNYVS